MTTNSIPAAMRRAQSLPVQKLPEPPKEPSIDAAPLKEFDSMEPFFSLELEPEEQPHVGAPSSQVQRACFDRSFSDLAKYQADLRHCETPLHKILQLCCPTSDASGQLNRHLQELKPRCMEDGAVAVRRVAEELQALGFVCQVWEEGRAYRDARSALRNLRHDFIVCLGSRSDGVTTSFPAPVIVEPMFKEQFHTGYTTDEFATLVKAIPSTFVGPLSKLRAIVSLVAAEMSRAFRVRGIDLPPWRSHQALLSLWRPELLEQLATVGPAVAFERGAPSGRPPQGPARVPHVQPGGSTSAPVSPTAGNGLVTPFAALAVSPFAVAAASAEGSKGTSSSDMTRHHADKPSGNRAQQAQAHSQAVPVPQRRAGKPVSMLAAALHHTTLRGRYEADDRTPSDTDDQFWGNVATVERQG